MAALEYRCIVCERTHASGKDKKAPMRCRDCGGKICPECQTAKSSIKENKCPVCGGEVYKTPF